MPTIAKTIIHFLEAQAISQIWGVPGESYLAVLDALVDSDIMFHNTRHEGAASMAAEAEGKLKGRPGVAFVTRGPGAMNAAHGVHIAQHDNTPMLLFIGQVPHRLKGRGAFQEMDYHAVFGSIAKAVITLDDPSRVALDLQRGWKTALEGRGGPVVFVLPEDCLHLEATPYSFMPIHRAHIKPHEADIQLFLKTLKRALRPILIVGGSQFSSEGIKALEAFSHYTALPICCSFRRQHYFNHHHPYYAGDLGHGCNPALLGRIKAADMIILLGAELEEVPSQGYSLLDKPYSRQKIVVIGHESQRISWLNPFMHIHAYGDDAMIAIEAQLPHFEESQKLQERYDGEDMHMAYETWSSPRMRDDEEHDDTLHLDQILSDLGNQLPQDTIMTNGAGNYALWLHRYYPFTQYGTQLAPVCGSMGYGLPAGLAAQAVHPERKVVVLAGDGCLQMSMNELITAKSLGLNIIILVFNNGSYGTIRAHQERYFPNRVSGTILHNPDFVKTAEAAGFGATRVHNRPAFLSALETALTHSQNAPYLIELMCDLTQISPAMRLDG